MPSPPSWAFTFMSWDESSDYAMCDLCGEKLKYVSQKDGKVNKNTNSLTDHLEGKKHNFKNRPNVVRVAKQVKPLFPVATKGSTEKMEDIASFFVLNGIARRVYDLPSFRKAFGSVIPMNTKRKDLEIAIHELAEKN